MQKERASPLRYIVASLLVFLLTASYLLFSASSVEFEITPPEPDAFDIEGGWFRLPVGNRVLLRKGNYTANVQKKGYYDVKQTFVVRTPPLSCSRSISSGRTSSFPKEPKASKISSQATPS